VITLTVTPHLQRHVATPVTIGYPSTSEEGATAKNVLQGASERRTLETCEALSLPGDYAPFNHNKPALLSHHAHFFCAGPCGEDCSTSALSLSAFDQLDRRPLYSLTPNLLLIEQIVVLLHDIRLAISHADISVDERR
jgi:hypothetical protein